MFDGWTDTENGTLIKKLVNSPAAKKFVKCIDAFIDAKTVIELLDSFVEEISERNVEQLITDNG